MHSGPAASARPRGCIRRRLCRPALLLALVAVPALAAAAADGPLLGQVVHVADGDTLTLKADADRYRIRLHAIDAPEHDQPWSRESRRALADKVQDKYVRVDARAVDSYGRTVAKVWLGERDIGREMVREGHAWAYRRFLDDRTLLADEAAARHARRGLWRHSEPVAPWQWRRRARAGREPSETRAEGRCDIKGNINRRGERIYHLPGSSHYPATRIDTIRGERWFCSVEEAERAGWRGTR